MYQFDRITGFGGMPCIERMMAWPEVEGPPIRIAHNSHGNRDQEFSFREGERNFLCFGGSHTWGAFVKNEERYSDILRRETGLNFMNLGHASFGLDQICIALMEKSAQYHPEGVLVEQYPWAFHRVLRSSCNDYLKPYFYIDDAEELKLKRMNYLAKYRFYRRVACAHHAIKKELDEFKNDIDIISQYDPLADPLFLLWKQKYYAYGYDLFARIAKRMSEYCHEKGIKFLLFLTAHQQQYLPSSRSDLIDYNLPLKLLRQALTSYQVPFVEFTGTLLEEHAAGNSVIMPDGHLNAYGHSVVARELKRELIQGKWL